MKKYIILFLLCVPTIASLWAQGGTAYDETSLRLSRNYFGGTARSMGMAGAFGALGADISTLSTNPAGLGVYNRGEYSITPSLKITGTEGAFVGNTEKANNTHFNINEFGFVSAMPTGRDRGLISVNLGFGMNRLADFRRNYAAGAMGTSFSQTHAFARNANGQYYADLNSKDYGTFNTPNWESVEAWRTGLIGSIPDPSGNMNKNSQYAYQSVLDKGEKVNQLNSVRESGRVDEYAFAIGFNINNKLYLGTTVGIQDIYYSNLTHHQETFENGAYSKTGYDVGYDYYQETTQNGSGVNFKFGAIYTPIPQLRFGLAIHTPTFISLSEDYYSEMHIYNPQNIMGRQMEVGGEWYYAYNDFSPPIADMGHNIHDDASPGYSNRADFETQGPYRALLSAAYGLGKKGWISFDYEYADYSRMSLSSTDRTINFSPENNFINNLYTSSNTFRVGVEYRISSSFLVRGGYAYYGSPYNENYAKEQHLGYEGATQFVTTGLGYRVKNFFIDLAYVAGRSDVKNYSIYTDDQAVVDYKMTQQRIALTFGVRL